MSLVKPTIHQEKALNAVYTWYNKDTRIPFRLGGWGGTGKTSLIPRIREEIGVYNSVVCTLTNKASSVLRSKCISDATTIHKTMYKLVDSVNMIWARNFEIDADLLIVDEASMIGLKIRSDLESYGIPILYTGDPFQLGPVGDDEVSIMENPDFMLTEVLRHGDKILDVCTAIRMGLRYPDVDQFTLKDDQIASYEVVICLSNTKRRMLNERIRNYHGRYGLPCRGDRVVMMKTDYERGAYNGEVGTLLEYNGRRYCIVQFDGWPEPISFTNCHFLQDGENPYAQNLRGRQCLDFGNAITCHKAQGSQYDSVLVWVERRADARWLYTAGSRAINKLDIAGL